MSAHRYPASPDPQPGRGKKDRTDPTDQSDPTDYPSPPSPPPEPTGRAPRLRPSGGYRQLRSFQAATIIYDATVAFCQRFLDNRSRTVDQMVQAARSGRQNIAEGSRAAATSSQTELRLVNVARASLDELLLDYEDFLRQRRLPLWDKNSPPARQVRELGRQRPGREADHPPDPTDPSDHPPDPTDRSDPSDDPSDHPSDSLGPYAPWLNHSDPAVVANTVICLIHQANYLLDLQIAALERQFIQEGGYSERLAAARIAQRQRSRAATPLPACPLCAKPMALRTARKGKNAGSQFWGCTGYPACKGARPLEGGG